MADLPPSLQGLYNDNERLRSLRADLQSAISDIGTSTVSVRSRLGDLPEQIEEAINRLIKSTESALVTDATAWEIGTLTADEFMDQDEMSYYFGLHELRLAMQAVFLARFQVRDFPVSSPLPQTESDAILLSMTEEQFEGYGFIDPVQETEVDYFFRKLLTGETFQDAAASELGDWELWPELHQANEVTDLDDTAGQTIRIPTEPIARNNSLVFEPEYKGDDPALVQRYLHGRSLRLEPDGDLGGGRLKLTTSGAIDLIGGLPNLARQILYRFRSRKGSLGPSNPFWGFLPLADLGDYPFPVAEDRAIEELRAQAADDPRVSSVTPRYDTLVLSGTRLSIDLDIRAVGSDQAETVSARI